MSGNERLALAAGLVIVYALFCLWCARRQNRHTKAGISDIVVAYASQTGTAIELANRSVDALKGQGRLLPLNQVDDKVLSTTRRALFVVSTYGQGEPPDNGARFARRYLNGHSDDLSHLEFAVLALGDSSYPDFCRFGRRVHQGLSEMGAKPLCDVIEMDALNPETSKAMVARWHHQLRSLGGELVPPADLAPMPCRSTSTWKLVERVLLNAESPGQPLFHLKFVVPQGEQPSWQPGDIAELVPPDWNEAYPQSFQIAPRKYSIASTCQDRTLDLVIRQQRNEQGQLGLASGWLTERIAIGDRVEIRLCDNVLFHSPAPDVPLILIGNGSGFAGLRAHLRYRQRNGKTRNWLVFGERDPQADNIFADELSEWMQNGNLEKLNLLFSRCKTQPGYVQDGLYTCESEVEAWVKAGAVIMVCGSREGMAQGVDRALENILGRELLDELETEGRYRRDIY